ncbi:MAG: aminotransferase class I/II-fold pyridoxal phosphate-dependent enzyme [Candidatus Kapabacteria bacterium]|nr:aminotransferase class I/II-fold pyridoxal phosphate-dependent enzyme [Candidatus Kapabacteria bacterium]
MNEHPSIIDLRSDTVTVPTEQMRQAMFDAKVGDDVYGEDPTVNALQNYVAELLGKEAALYVPSGTMSNQIAIAVNTKSGDEIIAESNAHIFYYETAAPAFISRVMVRQLPSERGEIPIDAIKNAIRPDIYYFPVSSMICLENTHNRHGGSIISLSYIKEVEQIAKENKMIFHLDGARLWNACAATEISPKEYAHSFDSISVCLSKGLGAPVGSVLVGSKETIKHALKMRKILGGGMRQAGILAAAGLYAIKNNFPLIVNDHKNAKKFALAITETDLLTVNIDSVETNMVVFQLKAGISADTFVLNCKNEGVLLSGIGGQSIRCVFHLQINETAAIDAASIIKEVLLRMV